MNFSPTWIGIYISWAGMVISLLASVHAIKQARAARRHQRATESPHFIFGRLLVARPAWKNNQGEDVIVMMEPEDERARVPDNYPQGGPVILCAHNRGLEARHLKVFSSSDFPTDLSFINKASEGCINQGDELQISYFFDKKRRGKNEKIHLRFETIGGEKMKQSFLITHGAVETKRL